jgi:hypothetical protein
MNFQDGNLASLFFHKLAQTHVCMPCDGLIIALRQSEKLDFMKFILSLFLIAVSLCAAAQADITSQVVAAFKKGDAAAIGVHLMPQVEITMPAKEGVCPSKEAQTILTQFFKENQVTGFTIKHQGTSKLDDQFRIAELNTAKGDYRVTFFMKKNANAMQIKQLKIEQD